MLSSSLKHLHHLKILHQASLQKSVLSIKDKQSTIVRLEKGEKGTNLSAEYNVSKQQISDIRKNKEKIMKFADILETSEGVNRKSLKLHMMNSWIKPCMPGLFSSEHLALQFLVPFCKKSETLLQPATHGSRRWRLYSFDRMA